MEKNNSIINSLKRLERIGQENSKTVQKLKEATAEVGLKLFDLTYPLRNKSNGFYFQGICIFEITAGLWVAEIEDCFTEIIFDWDNKTNASNFKEHSIINNVTRETALKFSEALANGLLDKIYEWINKRKIEMEIKDGKED